MATVVDIAPTTPSRRQPQWSDYSSIRKQTTDEGVTEYWGLDSKNEWYRLYDPNNLDVSVFKSEPPAGLTADIEDRTGMRLTGEGSDFVPRPSTTDTDTVPSDSEVDDVVVTQEQEGGVVVTASGGRITQPTEQEVVNSAPPNLAPYVAGATVVASTTEGGKPQETLISYDTVKFAEDLLGGKKGAAVSTETQQDAITKIVAEGFTIEDAGKAVAAASMTPKDKFYEGIRQGTIPKDARYAGEDMQGNPMYTERITWKESLLSSIPVYSTVRGWNQMSTMGKIMGVAGDALIVVPIGGTALRGLRAARIAQEAVAKTTVERSLTQGFTRRAIKDVQQGVEQYRFIEPVTHAGKGVTNYMPSTLVKESGEALSTQIERELAALRGTGSEAAKVEAGAATTGGYATPEIAARAKAAADITAKMPRPWELYSGGAPSGVSTAGGKVLGQYTTAAVAERPALNLIDVFKPTGIQPISEKEFLRIIGTTPTGGAISPATEAISPATLAKWMEYTPSEMWEGVKVGGKEFVLPETKWSPWPATATPTIGSSSLLSPAARLEAQAVARRAAEYSTIANQQPFQMGMSSSSVSGYAIIPKAVPITTHIVPLTTTSPTPKVITAPDISTIQKTILSPNIDTDIIPEHSPYTYPGVSPYTYPDITPAPSPITTPNPITKPSPVVIPSPTPITIVQPSPVPVPEPSPVPVPRPTPSPVPDVVTSTTPSIRPSTRYPTRPTRTTTPPLGVKPLTIDVPYTSPDRKKIKAKLDRLVKKGKYKKVKVRGGLIIYLPVVAGQPTITLLPKGGVQQTMAGLKQVRSLEFGAVQDIARTPESRHQQRPKRDISQIAKWSSAPASNSLSDAEARAPRTLRFAPRKRTARDKFVDAPEEGEYPGQYYFGRETLAPDLSGAV